MEREELSVAIEAALMDEEGPRDDALAARIAADVAVSHYEKQLADLREALEQPPNNTPTDSVLVGKWWLDRLTVAARRLVSPEGLDSEETQ